MKTNKKINRFTFLLLSLLFIFGCSGEGETTSTTSTTSSTSSVPADPGTSPPAVIPADSSKLVTTGSISNDTVDSSLIHINISGIINPDTKLPYDSLTDKNFTVVEDGIVKGIIVEKISDSSVSSKADVVFIMDTTGSMASMLSGMKSSVLNFMTYLNSNKLDVNVGGVAYSDVIVDKLQLSSDTTSAGVFNTWVNGLSACYKDNCGGDLPENGLDPIAYAMDNFTWRTGAQKIFVIITDINLHQTGDGTSFTTWTTDTLYNSKLKGVATVHSIGPDDTGTDHVKYLSSLTGGSWSLLPSLGSVDLTSLPIKSVIAAGYRITYMTKSATGSHTVRVIYTVDSNSGEFTITSNY